MSDETEFRQSGPPVRRPLAQPREVQPAQPADATRRIAKLGAEEICGHLCDCDENDKPCIMQDPELSPAARAGRLAAQRAVGGVLRSKYPPREH